MDTSFSDELARIVGYAREEAMRTGHYGLTPDHLVLGILRHGANPACDALKRLGINLKQFKEYIDSQVFRPDPVPYADEGRVGLTRGSHSTLNMAVFESFKAGGSHPDSSHLLLAVSRTTGNASADFFKARGIGYREIAGALLLASPAKQAGPEAVVPAAEEMAEAIEAEIRRTMSEAPVKSKYIS